MSPPFKLTAGWAAPLLLAACVYGEGGPLPLAPLAEDQSQPGPALLEHLLAGYLGRSATSDTSSVCVSLAPHALTAVQAQALRARFPRLAPDERCGDRSLQVIQVYAFACDNAANCSGWANVPGEPSARYALRWQDGRWNFARDPRLIAE